MQLHQAGRDDRNKGRFAPTPPKISSFFLALCRPIVTAPQLAKDLGLTHQGALLILARLREARIVQEVTGRGSFRAFAVPA